VQGLLVFACGLAVTSGVIWTMRRIHGEDHPLAEVAVLTAANLFVTAMRFVLMRAWILRVPPRR
jgi:hypothetical protein